MDWTTIEGLTIESGTPSLNGATRYCAAAEGDGLACCIPAGSLTRSGWLTADFMCRSDDKIVFLLELAEGEDGPVFGVWFSLLPHCQARMRLPLHLTDQHIRHHPREGAWTNIICVRDRVDPARVDRMRLTIARKGPEPAHWCMTAPRATGEEPPRLDRPILPREILIDTLGQAAWRDWPGKSRDEAQVTQRLHRQRAGAGNIHTVPTYSQWGGYAPVRFTSTGFFRTEHDGRRWWLVDPDGHPFWSTGPDCTGIGGQAAYEGIENAHAWLPDPGGPYAEAFSQAGEFGGYKKMFSFLQANLMRAFGADYRAGWAAIAIGEMRRIGFNTFGNWSDWQTAAAHRFPYVRQLDPSGFAHVSMIFRDMPDVFHPAFAGECERYAEPLRASADDPAFIGYFLMNEPQWGFIDEPLMQGILMEGRSCATRKAFARMLAERYGSNADLARTWAMEGVTFDAVADGPWSRRLSDGAKADLETFSTLVVARFFDALSAACRAVDPHHLNLGGRYYTAPPEWVQDGMGAFDVIGVNGYSERVRRELEPFSRRINKPVIIGEWHFGALDVGLPSSGIGHVRDQVERGKAYRVYLEDAAAQPWCVGAHWFTLYDEPAQGRFDGENYNIGFIDVCHRPYTELAEAARAAHERMYEVASGNLPPYDDRPEYLPLLF